MAEGMILALEGIRHRFFTGDLTADHVHRIQGYARKHGFRLAEYKRQAVLGTRHGCA
jgi:predicted amino acid dehydrogenase